MGQKYFIADFSGGRGYVDKSGNYTEEDKKATLDFFREHLPKVAAKNGVSDISGFVDANLCVIEEAIDKLFNNEGSMKKEPTIPRMLLERKKLRDKHEFSREYAKIASDSARHFYGWEYSTAGAIFKADEGITHMLNGNYAAAENAFRYAKTEMPIRDIVLRRCFELNIALTQALQGNMEGAKELYSKLGYKIVSHLDCLAEEHKKDVSKLWEVLSHNVDLISKGKRRNEFSLSPIETYVPLLILEDRIAVVHSTIPEENYHDKDREFWERGMHGHDPLDMFDGILVQSKPPVLKDRLVSFKAPENIPPAMRQFMREQGDDDVLH